MRLRRAKPDREAGQRFIEAAFVDAISWKASRVILVRLTNDPAFPALEPDLQASVIRFLARHPAT